MESHIHLLRNCLILGGLLFVVGAVGLATRRRPIVSVLSVGVMFQGIVLTLVAFGTFHGTWSGHVFALVAVVVVAAESLVALAMMGTDHDE